MSFKVGDKVLHPWTGERMLTVRFEDGAVVRADDEAERFSYDYHQECGLKRPASEFTPYTPPRVSTQMLWTMVNNAYARMWPSDIAAVRALAEAAIAYAERLESESTCTKE